MLFKDCISSMQYDCREGCYMQYIEGFSEKDFFDISDEIKQKGANVLLENETDDNRFIMFIYENKLYTVYFTPCDCSVRITEQSEYSVPQLTPVDYDNKCAATFYCFENDHSLIDCGMCILIQCCDYSFIIVDSGHYFQINDNDRIHKFMRERTPEGRDIVVSGWFVTHAHTDHICKLIDFLKYNCDDVVIEGFYSNLLSLSSYIDDWGYEEKLMAEKLFKVLGNNKAPCYKIHSGMKFYIRNFEISVLGTHEDIYPQRITDYNDSSCIITVKYEGSKIFIPGDASVKASEMLEKRYSEALKCDIVQVSHHGHTGLSSEAYKLIGAKVAVFPITRIKFDEEYDVQQANRTVISVSDEYYISSDGTIKIDLPYRKGSVKQLRDESFEDFQKIKRFWGYEYSEERKQELFELYLKNGGDIDDFTIPVNKEGFMETTKWLSYLK